MPKQAFKRARKSPAVTDESADDLLDESPPQESVAQPLGVGINRKKTASKRWQIIVSSDFHV